MAQVAHDERRETLRIATDAPAMLHIYGRRAIEAQMVDVSAGGTMVAIGVELRRGDEMLFVARGMDVVATVAWIAAGQFGLNFHRRLQLGEVALLTRRGRRGLVAAH